MFCLILISILQADYDTLGVTDKVDAASARDAFIKLAKQYHPDSGHPNADEIKFKQVVAKKWKIYFFGCDPV